MVSDNASQKKQYVSLNETGLLINKYRKETTKKVKIPGLYMLCLLACMFVQLYFSLSSDVLVAEDAAENNRNVLF